MNTLKERLIAARKKAKFSQRALADAAGMSQPSYSELETGKSYTTAYIARLASVLGVNALWLETGEGSMDGSVDAPNTLRGRMAAGTLNINDQPSIAPVLGDTLTGPTDSYKGNKVVERIPMVNPDIYALEVKGDGMQPFADEGWAVVIDPQGRPDILNRRVFVREKSGECHFGVLSAVTPHELVIIKTEDGRAHIIDRNNIDLWQSVWIYALPEHVVQRQ